MGRRRGASVCAICAGAQSAWQSSDSGGRLSNALDHFEAARHYPENLGEGKHLLTLERDLDYFSGLAAQKLGSCRSWRSRYWTAAAAPFPALGIHSVIFRRCALWQLGNAADGTRGISGTGGISLGSRWKPSRKIDYFATSLPNLLLFDDDLGKRNRIESLLLERIGQ